MGFDGPGRGLVGFLATQSQSGFEVFVPYPVIGASRVRFALCDDWWTSRLESFADDGRQPGAGAAGPLLLSGCHIPLPLHLSVIK
jgi:hypothetical protein